MLFSRRVLYKLISKQELLPASPQTDCRTKYKKIYSSDLVEQLFSYPIITPIKLGKNLDIHYTTATRHLNQLVEGGFLEDVVQGKYHLYINKKLLKIINKE